MSLKTWFLRLFKSTRNEERIVELEGSLKIQREHVSELNTIYIDRIAEIERTLDNHKAGHATVVEMELKRHEIIDEELKDLKHRIGKTELMHAATSKRQNDLFEDAMRNLMKLSSGICIHAMVRADEMVEKVTAAMNLPESKEYYMITVNEQIKTVYTERLAYDEIITLALGFTPKGDEKCSIVYTDGGDESKPFGTISEKDILLVKPGTVVNVSVISDVSS